MIRIKDYVPPTLADEKDMTENQLVEASIPFALTRAKMYWEAHKQKARSVEMQDLVGAGMEGLVIASRRFDKSRNLKFISFARWWIDRCIMRCMEQDLVVHKPVNRIKDYQVLIAHSKSTGMDLYECAIDLGWDDHQYNCAVTGHSPPVRGSAEYDTDYAEEIPCNDDVYDDMSESISQMLELLSAREAEVIYSYFYMGERLDAIGKRLCLTRERIRQIKEVALNKMRKKHGKKAKELLVSCDSRPLTFFGKELF